MARCKVGYLEVTNVVTRCTKPDGHVGEHRNSTPGHRITWPATTPRLVRFR